MSQATTHKTDFAGKRVIVTGASQGIGRDIVIQFLAQGAKVAALDLDAAGLAYATELGASLVFGLDHSNEAAVMDAKAAVIEALGGVDIIVMAAGGVRGQVNHPVETIELSAWKQLFEANVDGAFLLTKAFAPLMKEQGNGRIITIASGAGLRPSLTGIQAYSAAKHALVGLTKQLALELGKFGITVNSVAPGFIISNPATQRQWESYGEDGQKKLLESIHMRRLGKPSDITNAVLFLATDASEWISGQILSVDGGRA